MRIMLVVNSIGVGGAERVVSSLANAFAARGHAVCIVTLETKRPALPVSESVQLVELNARKSMGGLLHVITSLRDVVRSFKPDIVHSHMIHSNLVTRLVRCMVPIPRLISTAHNSHDGGWHRVLANRLTHRLADLATNVSSEAVAAYEKRRAVPQGQMLTVHNGIDTRAFHFSQGCREQVRDLLGVGSSTPLILAVGRLEPEKNYPNLLNALSRLPGHLRWRAVIAGTGPLQADLLKLADELRLADRVSFLGVRSDVRNLMNAADVFVLSSNWEGFPMVVGEAMACERLVVATDCGGVAEFTGGLGYLVPPQNPDALASGLAQAIALPRDQARQIGRQARERVQTLFSLDAAVDRWLGLYRGDRIDSARSGDADACAD
ncbi:glycosyltransferase [Stenotrophomonas koreensis]|uniref:glycosyltransferase n=1 Tax=Stenotrophomonas koreensis TaxID=266128 RepID=UPI00339780B2